MSCITEHVQSYYLVCRTPAYQIGVWENSLTEAVVGLRGHHNYTVSENVSMVEVCTIVYSPIDILICPIDHAHAMDF